MSILSVPGARLYYHTVGSGPVLVMIPGASGTADVFQGIAAHLAPYFTVVTYDRRGFFRSQLDGLQDYAQRLETDTADVERLITHLSSEPAIVFGTSSGAVVALQLLTKYPGVVRRLFAFEPAAVGLLSDGKEWIDFFSGVYDLYREHGIDAALEKFRKRTFPPSDREIMARAMDPKNGSHIVTNATYWFEHELRQYTDVPLDLDAIAARKERLTLLAGVESREYPTYRVNAELAKRLRLDLIELPGGHVGYAVHPKEFTQELLKALPGNRLG